MRIWGALVAAAGLGCGAELSQAPPPSTEPPVRQAVITLHEGASLQVGGAWIDESGDGRGVDALATVPGTPPLEIRADRTEWSLNQGRIVFTGAVEARRDGLILVTRELEITLVDDVVDRAVATGDLRITHQGREATAGRAVYRPAEHSLELTGKPRLRDSGREMRGHRIVLRLDSEQVVCEDCKVRVVVQEER